MEFGASIFFTDYSITPTELAVEMEERGFDSVWAAEHRRSRCRARQRDPASLPARSAASPRISTS
jgi:alkanesulfonate monooxygenase SsuD/methylene tetrahydromethanopterin reductase-like flavin-dependent oxidoreductase (luciferase family)